MAKRRSWFLMPGRARATSSTISSPSPSRRHQPVADPLSGSSIAGRFLRSLLRIYTTRA
jgi:hypothetical protein